MRRCCASSALGRLLRRAGAPVVRCARRVAGVVVARQASALGLAFASKYTAILLPLTVVVAVLVRPSLRERLREPGPYVACVVATLVFLPVLRWNATHDWISFRFQLQHGLGHGEGLGAQARARSDRRAAGARVADPVRAGGRRRLARAAPSARRRAASRSPWSRRGAGCSSSTARCAVRSRPTGRRRRTSPASRCLRAAGDVGVRVDGRWCGAGSRSRRCSSACSTCTRSCRCFPSRRGATRSRAAHGWDGLAAHVDAARERLGDAQRGSARSAIRTSASSRTICPARPQVVVHLSRRPAQPVRAVARLRRARATRRRARARARRARRTCTRA